MATDLATLRDRVEDILLDSGNAIWDTDAIDEAIHLALDAYTKIRPLHRIETISIAADTREVDASTLTSVLNVTVICCPFTASEPEWPPNYRTFTYWPDSKVIHVTDDYEPEAGQIMRVFFTAPHTLDGLATETVTSFPDDDESLLALGAAGFAATSRAIDLQEQVSLSKTTAAEIRAWGEARLESFFRQLLATGSRHASRTSVFIAYPKLDRWEGNWA